MILHIFKKDIRILWAFALGVALTDLAAAILQALIESFQLRADAQILTVFLWALTIIALVFGFAVIAMVVQLDPIPGARQDWLARPIRRRDMLLAKLLFVVIFIQIPLLAADVLHGVMSGFSIHQTLAAAGARNLYLAVLMTLPVMALAAMTEGVKQTLGLGLAISVGALAFAGAVLELYNLAHVASDNGETATSFILQMAIMFGGASTVLVLQYFRRATRYARPIAGLVGVLTLAARFLLPQDAAYALEARFSTRPGQDLTLVFAPEAGRLKAASSRTSVAGAENAQERSILVALPFAIQRLPAELILIGRDVRAVLTAPDGDSLTLQTPQDIALQTSGSPVRLYYQALRIPGDFFDAHRNQPLRLKLDYELAVHGQPRDYELAAQGGKLHIPGLGRCATVIGPVGANVLLHCMQVGEERLRVDAALTDDVKQLSNPTRHQYSPTDAPYRNGDSIITRFNTSLFFRDTRSDTAYPVGAAQISEAAVRLTVSEPLTWIVRHINITNVRLDAWTVQK